ncbi:hypothetical protein AMATHDRAFT_151334 [Amanita thiersii Skay4041]|uniref:Uncharacterized protein n=1 Tax=Amanita thiersii Skay4041 TaxID=703135 RepID=A0A2A9NHP0_9AGAR|nr:hypothetical protein AMATHDRAFT_151334 [Amanita thiersii Skay4041]
MSSNLSTASGATIVPKYVPDEYERTSYYNGITGDKDHPELVYRSDFHTTFFPKPTGRYAHIPIKSLRGIFGTPLNNVWDTVGPQICDLIRAWKIRWSSIDPVAFNEVGIESVELGIYNSGNKTVEVFSAKGDSGSLVWHMTNGKAHIVGQLHSGCNKGGSTSNHVTYCTPGWYLLDQIKKRFKYADFYRTTWSA